MTTIYKICPRTAWRSAEQAGIYAGSEADTRDGFIHFSTAAQLAGTAAKHFARQRDLLVIAVNAEALGSALKWELSRGGDLFPHLYASLPLAAVRWTRPLPEEIDGERAIERVIERVLPELGP